MSARGIGGYAIEIGSAASFLSTYHEYQVSISCRPARGQKLAQAHLLVAELFCEFRSVRSSTFLFPLAEPPESACDECEHDEDEEQDTPPGELALLLLIRAIGGCRFGGDRDEILEADAESGDDDTSRGRGRRLLRRGALALSELLPCRTGKAGRRARAGAGRAARVAPHTFRF